MSFGLFETRLIFLRFAGVCAWEKEGKEAGQRSSVANG